MKTMIAFDLDGTLAESKQAISPEMAERLKSLLEVADVAVISGGDWPQFDKQVVSQLPAEADLSRLWIMPTTGTKLFRFDGTAWQTIYAEVFDRDERQKIAAALNQVMREKGYDQGQTWGERIEDRGSQITFSALGQEAPLEAKKDWDPDFAKRKLMKVDLAKLLPGLSINMGGSTRSTSRARGSTRLMACASWSSIPAPPSRTSCSWVTRSSRAATTIRCAPPVSIASRFAIPRIPRWRSARWWPASSTDDAAI